MWREEVANRTDELKRFQEMLENNIEERIFFIEGLTKHGKTLLLRKFGKIAKNALGAGRSILIELKAGNKLEKLFLDITRTLHAEAFIHFDRAYHSRNAQPIINLADISHATLTSHNTINVEPRSNFDHSDRNRELTNAIITDLESRRLKTVLVFDSYESSPPFIREWMVDSLLPAVHENENLIVVVGGQQTISATEYQISWGGIICSHRLEQVRSVDDWHEYACKFYPGFPRAELDGICNRLYEMPDAIVMYIKNRIRELETS